MAVMQPGTDVPSLLFTCITHMCVYMSADTHAHAHVQALTLTPVLTADFSAPPLLCLPHHLLLPCSSQSPCQPLTPRFPPHNFSISVPQMSMWLLTLFYLHVPTSNHLFTTILVIPITCNTNCLKVKAFHLNLFF